MSYKITQRMTDEEFLKTVIYRDAMIMVLNKPSGIPVHNAGGSVHNLEQYFHLIQFGLKNPPVLAHRLDLGTSGCLVLARHANAARVMQQLFTDGLINKSYVAKVHGVVKKTQGTIDVSLSKLSSLKKHWWMKADENGKYTAITDYQVISHGDDHTFLKLMPKTGRTHQLRVHCAFLGHSIIGDYIYGTKKDQEKNTKLHLHAHSIEIPLYKNKHPLQFNAPPPEHMI